MEPSTEQGFSGTGDFSGPMVQAELSTRGMIPGDYAITAILGDGSRVDVKSSLLAPHKAPSLRKSTSPGM